MTYADVVSGVTAVLSIPFVVLKGAILSLPTLSYVTATNCECDKFADMNLSLLMGTSGVINTIEKYWIYGLSLLFYPFGYCNYQKNEKIINLLRENVKTENVNYSQLLTDVRNAIKKEGFWEVTIKMLSMFSILPTYRHAFLNNPFLFEYEMYLTNQQSKPFKDIDKMTKIIYSYLTDPTYILLEESKKNSKDISVDDIGFTPNYYNNTNDMNLNYSNVGMQVAGKYTTLIYLETINKSPTELYNAIVTGKMNNTFMHANNPIYETFKDINIVYNVKPDEKDRYKFLDLVVPYDCMYHVVTGKVEANVTQDNQIEHPMLCLYHNGATMKWTWDVINDLFTNNVMDYLNKLE